MVEIKNLSIQCGTSRDIIRDLTMDIKEGEFFGVIGRAGSGKSAFASGLAGSQKYDGSISLHGRELNQIPSTEINRLISKIENRNPYNPDISLNEFILLSRVPFKPKFRSFSESDREIAEKYITGFKLQDFSETPIGTLSSSQLTLTLLAFALAREAPLLILDEPVSFLDPEGSVLLSMALKKYLFNGNRSTAVCSNDLNFIFQNADRIALLDEGRLVSIFTHSEIDSKFLMQYFGLEGIITRNVYNGRPVVNFFTRE